MRSFFSEFSYGFALTYEITRLYHDVFPGAPEFPNLYQEGQPGHGYDVQLPFPVQPLFLQFKVSERMEKRTAAEWDRFDQPYYRFKLHARRHSDQHQMLIDLEGQGNEVYYAAPMFNQPEVLNDCFRTRTVMNRTAFFSPTEIAPLPDDNEHCVAFLPTSDHGFVCSEPRRIKVAAFGRAVRESMDQDKERPRRILRSRDDLQALVTSMEAIVRERQSFQSEPPRGEDVVEVATDVAEDLTLPQRAGYLSRTYFDAEFLLIRRP